MFALTPQIVALPHCIPSCRFSNCAVLGIKHAAPRHTGQETVPAIRGEGILCAEDIAMGVDFVLPHRRALVQQLSIAPRVQPNQ